MDQKQQTPIHSKYHGDPLYQPLINDFLGDLPALYAEIVGNIESADWLAVAGFCHQLKGTAATYGYDDLASIVSSIETHSKLADQRPVDPSIEIHQLVQRLDRVMNRMLTARTQI